MQLPGSSLTTSALRAAPARRGYYEDETPAGEYRPRRMLCEDVSPAPRRALREAPILPAQPLQETLVDPKIISDIQDRCRPVTPEPESNVSKIGRRVRPALAISLAAVASSVVAAFANTFGVTPQPITTPTPAQVVVSQSPTPKPQAKTSRNETAKRTPVAKTPKPKTPKPFIPTSSTYVRTNIRGNGDLVYAQAGKKVGGTKKVYRYSVALETALKSKIDLPAAAEEIQQTFADPRGWSSKGFGFVRVADPKKADFTVKIVTPPTVDRLCYPLATNGLVNCRAGKNVVLNGDRWMHGVPSWKGKTGYRQYLVNHETGHFLGYGHEYCSGYGKLAPVMQQQSGSTRGCEPNPWVRP